MKKSQERKYDAVDGKLVNRETGKAIPDHEPVMIFRAKDKLALVAILAYRQEVTDGTHAEVVQAKVEEFEAFAEEYPDEMKYPDSGEGCLTTYEED